MKKLSLFLPRKTLLTIYKSFARPILDYVDIIYDKIFNGSFTTLIEMIQSLCALTCNVRISGWMYTLQLPECQGTPCLKQARYMKFNITPVWLNGSVFVLELSGCGFKSRCTHLDDPVLSSSSYYWCYLRYIKYLV